MKERDTIAALGGSKSLVLLLPALVLTACGGPEESGYGEMPPPAVTSVVVEAEDVDFRGNYAGRIRGAREVEVRARVGGIVEERLYTEGERVDRGDVLFQIEMEPYEIALQQAEAEQANAEAEFNQAEREWRRIKRLYDQDAVSERERDRALSNRELAEARIASAVARRAAAQLNLDYTRVLAPISGSTGLESLPEGSLIERGELLTTIVQQDPVHVRFSVPEKEAAIQRAIRRAAGTGGEDRRQEARLRMPDGGVYEVSGVVDFTDSTIDPRTGTVSLRAVFENAEGELTPGQFVRVEIVLRKFENVFRIDPAAVSEGPDGPRVFVVGEENTAEARSVRLGPVIDGKQTVLGGIEEGERLVVNGHVGLQDGVTVAAENPDGEVE